MTGTATPPSGWYSDPSQPGAERYWDGSSWTEATRPLPTASSAAVVPHANNDTPPPWAAEVVEAEAARLNGARPWWKTPWFLGFLAFIIIAAVASIVLPFNQPATETSNFEGNGKVLVSGPDDIDESESSSTTERAEASEESTSTRETAPTTSAQADASSSTESTATDAGDTPTTVKPAQDASTTSESAAPTAETTTTEASTTTESAATDAPTTTALAGVSAECLDTMQAAAEVADLSDRSIELHPTFEQCATEDEWMTAATFTGIAVRLDTTSWITNVCVTNADLYELPLCTSSIDPASGPRRIDCGDGRQTIEWTAVDDAQTNDDICENYFQLVCPDGNVQNIPREAFSEEEAEEALCA